MIDPANILASPAVNTGAEETDDRTALDRDAFLKLLVTQLENQDPLDPMDSREMITQLSELSSVEYLMGIERKLGSLELAGAGSANTEAASLVGKEVVVDGSGMSYDGAGAATASYTLPAAASSVSVTVRNAAGEVVNVAELGARGAGQHDFNWDGSTAAGGRGEPGNYRISVAAVDQNGQSLVTSTDVRGVVQSVSYENGFPELRIGSTSALLGDVRSIGSASTGYGVGGSSTGTQTGTDPGTTSGR